MEVKKKEVTKNYFLQATSIYFYTEYLIDQNENM